METCINAKVLRQRIDELPGFSLEERYLAKIDLEESIFNLVRTILEENADISEGLMVSQFQSILAELEKQKPLKILPPQILKVFRRTLSKRLHWKRKFLSGILKNQRSNQNP